MPSEQTPLPTPASPSRNPPLSFHPTARSVPLARTRSHRTLHPIRSSFLPRRLKNTPHRHFERILSLPSCRPAIPRLTPVRKLETTDTSPTLNFCYCEPRISLTKESPATTVNS